MTRIAAAAACIGAVMWAAGRLDGYWGLLLLTLLLQGTLVWSYDILGGYGGELHLGHGLFFGLGAYASALGVLHGLPGWASLGGAAAVGGLAAAMVAPVLVPLRGVPFAIASLALLLVGGMLARNLEGITGGSAGLSVPPLWDLPRTMRGALVLFAAAFWIHDVQRDGRFGRALRAGGQDSAAAGMMGVDVHRIRRKALILGAVPAALAGGLYPFYFAYISPQSGFGLETALAPVVMVLVGGPGTRWGPLLGLLLMVGVQEWLWTRGWDFRLALWGGALMATGAFLPRGLAGLIPRARKHRGGRGLPN